MKGPGAMLSVWCQFLRCTDTTATCILSEVSNEIKLRKAQQLMKYNCLHVLRKNASIIFSGVFSKTLQGVNVKLITQTVT